MRPLTCLTIVPLLAVLAVARPATAADHAQAAQRLEAIHQTLNDAHSPLHAQFTAAADIPTLALMTFDQQALVITNRVAGSQNVLALLPHGAGGVPVRAAAGDGPHLDFLGELSPAYLEKKTREHLVTAVRRIDASLVDDSAALAKAIARQRRAELPGPKGELSAQRHKAFFRDVAPYLDRDVLVEALWRAPVPTDALARPGRTEATYRLKTPAGAVLTVQDGSTTHALGITRYVVPDQQPAIAFDYYDEGKRPGGLHDVHGQLDHLARHTGLSGTALQLAIERLLVEADRRAPGLRQHLFSLATNGRQPRTTRPQTLPTLPSRGVCRYR